MRYSIRLVGNNMPAASRRARKHGNYELACIAKPKARPLIVAHGSLEAMEAAKRLLGGGA